MFVDMPYFMNDESWYRITSQEDRLYKLTEKAPPDAIKSYEEYYLNKDNIKLEKIIKRVVTKKA